MPLKLDVTKEEPILFSEGKKKLPDQPSWQQLNYWHETGILHRDRRIKLEAIRLPRGKATTMSAYQRFIEKLNQ